MWISKYLCIFMIYSFLGWIYETTFCTIKGGKWENRGFLYGPVCPIYGVAGTTILLLLHLCALQSFSPPFWLSFLVIAFGSAFLEYFTSWGLEKVFHAVWWDYSNLPLNLHGRISLFTTLGFGGAGLLMVYGIAPLTDLAFSYIPPLVLESLALVFVALFASDFTLTVTALRRFDQIVIRAETQFNKNMDTLVDNTVQRTIRIKTGLSTKQKSLSDGISQLGGFSRAAVRRVKSFRYNSASRERANAVLLVLKKRKKDSD